MAALPICGGLQQAASLDQYMILGAVSIMCILYSYYQTGIRKNSQIDTQSRLISYYSNDLEDTVINRIFVCGGVLIFILTVTIYSS